MVRLPLVSQYFWTNLGGCGHQDVPHLDSQLPSPRLTLKMPPRLPLPNKLGGPGSVWLEFGRGTVRAVPVWVPVVPLQKGVFFVSVHWDSFTGKDGSSSGFGSCETVPAVPVPLSVSRKNGSKNWTSSRWFQMWVWWRKPGAEEERKHAETQFARAALSELNAENCVN